MIKERWKDIKGFEGRYQISSGGRVRSLPFKQRYTHWRTGQELFRQTKGRLLATQGINSGYLIVHLHKDNKRTAFLVHRLVAEAFLLGEPCETVNHKDGNKKNNHVQNLEWATYTENHLHAVATGLNRQAIRVRDPLTGKVYGSIAQAARKAKKSHRKVRATFLREDARCLL